MSGTVLIAGAGATGLAIALESARLGWQVVVFERRSDPKEGNALGADGAWSSTVWSNRVRNVVLDTRALEYLVALGVPANQFPLIERIRFFMPRGQPFLDVRFGDRELSPGRNNLDSDPLLFGRDIAVQPSIGEIERALRASVDAQPAIELRFDSQALEGVDVGDRVIARCGAVETPGDLLFVADGGGRTSVTRRLGVTRQTVYETGFDYTVFKPVEGSALDGFAFDRAFVNAGLRQDGFVMGVAGNGETVVVAFERNDANSKAPSRSATYLHCRGVDAGILDAPLTFRCEIDRASEVRRGDRIFIVGDAAARGSPTLGCGVQFGLLWAQLAARTVLVAGPTPAALREFDAQAERTIGDRLTFEQAYHRLVDGITSGRRSLLEIQTSPEMARTVRKLKLRYRRLATGARLRFQVHLDFSRLKGTRLHPEEEIVRALERLVVKGDLRLFAHGGDVEAVLSSRHPLVIETGKETLTFDSGRMHLERADECWRVILTDVTMRRRLNTVRVTRQQTATPIRRASLTVPDATIDELMRLPLNRLSSLLVRRRAFVMEYRFADGSRIDLGMLRFRLDGGARLRVSMGPASGRRAMIRIEVRDGTATMERFWRFLEHSTLTASRVTRGVLDVSGGLLEKPADQLATLMSSLIRRVDFELLEQGDGILWFDSLGILPIPVYLGANDVDRLRAELCVTPDRMNGFLRRLRRDLRSVAAEWIPVPQ